MTNTIADMLTRIRNAQAVQKPAVEVACTKMTQAIAALLERKGFIRGSEPKGKRTKKTLEIFLKYREGSSAISGARCVSTPGQRIYAPSHELKEVRGGMGIVIVSTSKGLMTGREAKKAGIGGEVLCEIW